MKDLSLRRLKFNTNKNNLDNSLAYKAVMSIGFKNYFVAKDGISKFVLEQQQCVNKNSINYIFIYPILIPQMLEKFRALCKYWGVIVNGKEEGIFSTKEIKSISKNYDICNIYIQHFQRLREQELLDILDSFNKPIKYFLHDYYSVCEHYCLLDDDNKYCGEGPISEKKCSPRCDFAKYTLERHNLYVDFFKRYSEKLEVISPSKKAADVFRTYFPDVSNIRIVPHQLFYGKNVNFPTIDDIKVAYVGYQAENKGYHVWKKLISDIGHNKYKFFHFGKSNEVLDGVKYISVDYKQNYNMTTALKAEGINIVMLWSIWPETYSYTYYESFSANAFIITNKLSGNICDQVLINGNGIVLDDYFHLKELFSDKSRIIDYLKEFYQKKSYGPLKLEFNMPYIIDIKSESSKLLNAKFKKALKSKTISIVYSIFETWRKYVNMH